eukprot:555964-Heterocapsa_arctica.AAC.1
MAVAIIGFALPTVVGVRATITDIHSKHNEHNHNILIYITLKAPHRVVQYPWAHPNLRFKDTGVRLLDGDGGPSPHELMPLDSKRLLLT